MSELTLETLPEEVILTIFGYFKLKDLMNCGQLSKRIRRIARDEKLWQRVDVNDKKVSTNFLEMILGKGCRFLGGKYLVFVSSRSVKMRGSSAFSVCIFLRKVCLSFKN